MPCLASFFDRSPVRPARPSHFAGPLARVASQWLRIVLFFAWATAAAYAQTVHWEAGDSGDPAELQLIF